MGKLPLRYLFLSFKTWRDLLFPLILVRASIKKIRPITMAAQELNVHWPILSISPQFFPHAKKCKAPMAARERGATQNQILLTLPVRPMEVLQRSSHFLRCCSLCCSAKPESEASSSKLLSSVFSKDLSFSSNIVLQMLNF